MQSIIDNANQAAADAAAAAGNANAAVSSLEEKVAAGDFNGADGAPGESGVTVPTSGAFTLSGDAEGNLYCYYTDESNPPSFETEENGDIYINIPDGTGE